MRKTLFLLVYQECILRIFQEPIKTYYYIITEVMRKAAIIKLSLYSLAGAKKGKTSLIDHPSTIWGDHYELSYSNQTACFL